MCLPTDDIPRRQTHEANKREAYDGMRAYHQSEIAHKKDAVDLIKTILTTTVILYAGLVGSSTTGKIATNLTLVASWVVALLVGAAVAVIVYFTNRKIDQDNERYRKYREEYVKERDLIGLDDDLNQAGYTSAWIEEQDPTKTGYHHTKSILRAFAVIVFVVALVGVGFVYGVAYASDHQSCSEKVSYFQQLAPADAATATRIQHG